MKKERFVDKSKVELLKLLAEKRAALRRFRFGLGHGKVKNVKEGRELRKEIARILTNLKQNA